MQIETGQLKIFLLGSPRVEWNGRPLNIRRRNVRALLYRLAADANPVPRAHLCLLFWPGMGEGAARRNLSHALTHLRRALPAALLLQTGSDAVGLGGDNLWCDVRLFCQTACQQPADTEQLQRAAALYGGNFLAGFSLPGCSEFEHWVTLESGSLERQYLEMLETLVDRLTAAGEPASAIRFARQYLQTDELCETIHRKLIALYAATGERGAALQQYESCLMAIERELGVSPLPETRAVYRSVLAGAALSAPTRGERSTRQPRRLVRAGLPLVGREQPWRSLEESFRRVRAGGGQIVLVSGESGVGKTCLLQAFAANCQPQACILWGAGYPGGQTIPYRPIVEAIRFARREPACGVELSPAWLAEVSRLLPELRGQHPDLPAPLPAEPEDARIRLFDALSRYLFSLPAAGQPLLFCMDDLHWCDPTTLDWLPHFSRDALQQGKPFLFLGSYREEESGSIHGLRQGWERLGAFTEIKLAGLDEADVLQIIRQRFGGFPDEAQAASRLRLATGGNPFFVLELLQALLETADRPEFWDSLENLPLPRGVQEIIRARILRLEAKTRQALEACAVLGESFRFDWACLTAGRSEAEMTDSIEILIADHWLVERNSLYQFAHHLARRTVEAGLSPVRRQLLLRRAARALEQLDPKASLTLAHFFEAGGEWEKALHYHALAAQQAEALFAWQEAEKHYTRQLALLELLDPLKNDPALQLQRAQALSSRAHLCFLQGRQSERDEDLTQLRAFADTTGNRAVRLLALNHQVRYLNLDGKYEQAIQTAEEGMQLAGEDQRERYHFLAQVGFAHYFLGKPRPAIAALQPALEWFIARSDPEMRGRIAHILGYLHFHLGDYTRALNCQREASACHLQVGDQNRVAWDTIDIGACLLHLNQWEAAKRSITEGLELARRIAARPPEVYGLYYLGCWGLARQEAAAALEVFQQAQAVSVSAAIPQLTIGIEIGLGMALLCSGKPEEARARLEPAAANARALGLSRRLCDALIGLGMVEAASCRPALARQRLGEAAEIARDSEYADGLKRALAAL